MRVFRLILLVPSFFLVLACHGGDREEPSAHFDRSTRRPVIDGLYALDGLRESCERAGARFREHKKECECPSLQFKTDEGQIFSTIDGGSCLSLGRPVPPSHEASCSGEGALKEAYMADGIEGLNKCLRNFIDFRGTHFGVELAEGTTAKDALKLARTLDKESDKVFAKLWPSPENYFFNSTVLVHAGKTHVDKSFVQALLQPPSIQEKGRYRVTFIEPDINRVLSSLGHPLDPPETISEVPASVGGIFPEAFYVQRVYEKILADNLNDPAIRVGGDCRVHCMIQQTFEGDQDLGLRAVREKSYLYGVPYRDIVRVSASQSGDTVAFLHLNLRGSASTISFISRDLRGETISSRVRVFDRLWNGIGDETFVLLENLSQVRADIERVPSVGNQERGSVVLCEAADFASSGAQNLMGSLRRVEGSSENSVGLFGWIRNPGESLARLISPLMELTEMALPIAGSAGHGVGIARTLLSTDSKRGLIPISMPSCLKEFSLWSPETRLHEIGTVNFSGSYPVDAKWCESFFPVAEIFNDQAKELWVAAAGNSGTANPSERCPQALGVKPNLIVVAGGDEHGLWRDSDYGVDYADIAASPGGPDRNEQGTSFSAPRVSALAADLAREFPRLSPNQIRLAILGSATIPQGQPLEVRSGGALNRTMSRKLAKGIGDAEESPVSRDTLLTLWTDLYGRDAAQRRLGLWRQRGLLP